MCQMKDRRVRGSTPLMAIRNRRDHPAITRSGHAPASALITASPISWPQWLVDSVTGAGGNGHTTVPCFARTVTGRNVPSFLGIAGSIRYARAINTADIVLGYDELTKPTTW